MDATTTVFIVSIRRSSGWWGDHIHAIWNCAEISYSDVSYLLADAGAACGGAVGRIYRERSLCKCHGEASATFRRVTEKAK